jgi:hypothetical protein
MSRTFLPPEAYAAYYLDTAAHFRRLAIRQDADRRHWLALGREAVHYARRMRKEAY